MIKSGSKDVYIYYDFNSGTWLFKPDAQQVWRDCVKPYMMMKNYTEEDLESIKTATCYIGLIRNYAGYRRIEKIKFDNKVDIDFIPMGNGDYNWKSKEFIPRFNPALHNQHRYTYTYNPEAGINSKGVKILNEWLTWTYKDTPTKQAVLDWLALNVAGLAGETNKILCFWGQPGSGKSVILNLINNLLDELAAPIDSKKLGLSDNRFIFQSADGKYATTIDEFRTNQIGWDNLKQLAGSYKPIIDVEKKGLTNYKSIYRGSVTTASQDTFSLPPYHDGGIRRRIVTIQHTEEMINPMYADIDYRLAQPDVLNDIFNWLITLDMDAALERFKEYAKSVEVKQTIMKVLVDSDTVLQFMKEKIEFTNNPNDRVSNLEVQVAYKRFLIEDLYQPIDNKDDHKIAKVTQYIREKASIKDNGFDWKLCPKKGENVQITVDGKRVRGLKGLRIVNTVSDSDSLI
jgi:ABC-type dipeptide/oligopeptide/nickel transport system ATPase component